SEARTDYAVLGDSIILAQRLESAAPRGEIYVGDLTYRLTKNSFAFEWVGELTVKGKSEPVPAWRLVGALDAPLAEAAGASRASAALLGRETEFDRASLALSRLVEGGGGLLTVVGEAGVGKSRFTREVASDAQRRGLRWMQVRCLSHGAALTYSPFAQLVRDFAQINITQPPELAVSALATALARTGNEEAGPYFARLLGLPPVDDASDVAALAPEAFRRGLHDAFARWLVSISVTDRLVVMIEDCQWMDPSSRVLAEELLSSRAGGRFLLCLAARTDGQETLDKLSAVADHLDTDKIKLGNFDSAQVEFFLSQILEAKPPKNLAKLVYDRTGGNPFFVEELVQALLDEGAIVRGGRGWRMHQGWQEATVPPNLEGVLSARIDRLPTIARTTLLDAAVIGRRIPPQLLDGISPRAADGVPDLIEKGFFTIVPNSEGELEFSNALVQEAAYARLLRRQRRALHKRVAELAETLYGAGDDVIDMLARHAYLGNVGSKAIGLLVRAGERAERLFANEQAIVHLTRALELARAEPD
ncbi:MAG: AAA family ATPase, partial [Candidatus Nanopelagicales bacterium]